MTHDGLEVELRKLDPRERARLAAALLNSLEPLSDDENARLWAEEAARRSNGHYDLGSIRHGRLPGDPGTPRWMRCA